MIKPLCSTSPSTSPSSHRSDRWTEPTGGVVAARSARERHGADLRAGAAAETPTGRRCTRAAAVRFGGKPGSG